MDSEKVQTFGGFLTNARKSRRILLKDVAEKLGVSAVYLCDVEKNRRAAPKVEYLEIIADYLGLSESERDTMYDLAANTVSGRKSISFDLIDYIMQKEVIRMAIRTAKKYDVGDNEWLDFTNRIKAGRESIGNSKMGG